VNEVNRNEAELIAAKLLSHGEVCSLTFKFQNSGSISSNNWAQYKSLLSSFPDYTDITIGCEAICVIRVISG
jgi:hypothetical protein